MLQLIRERLEAAQIALPATWENDVTAWGRAVALYREYAEGNHRAKMTAEMRQMLRITDARTEQFSINYCDLVIQKMGDRLTVTSVEGDNAAASKWSADVLAWNRYDGLQMDVHDAGIRDGVTYVMVAYDNDAQMPLFAHELAWDGLWGMIAVYDRMGKRVVAAIKVWYETDTQRRVNIYYPDRVERLREDGASLMAMDEQPVEWMDVSGKGVGVPVVAFVNNAKARLTTGRSEIASVIPMQDGLNRTLVSMVMTAELSAFQIRVADGFTPPAAVTPGMWVNIPEHEGQTAQAYVLEQAQLVPFISQAQFLIEQIGTVSQTPLPSQMGGDNASGEAMKQRETGLLGKVKRAQIKFGNAWEDVLALAVRVQAAFGTKVPPKVNRWDCQWQDAEIRNDEATIKSIKEVAEIIGEKQALWEIASVLKWDEAKTQRVWAEKQAEKVNVFAALAQNMPDFGGFTGAAGASDPVADPLAA